MGPAWVSTSFGIVDTTFLHICSDPAVRTPFGVYLVCVPSTLVSDRLYRSSYLPYQKRQKKNMKPKNKMSPPTKASVGTTV